MKKINNNINKEKRDYFTEEEIKNIQTKGLEIMGTDLRYSEMCDKLKLKKANGSRNKEKQLRNLRNVLHIEEIPNGRQVKYRITEVYDKPLLPYYDTNEWYAAFKSRVCEIIKSNNYNDVWFTRTPLLRAVGMVNDNYKIMMNQSKRDMLAKYFDRDLSTEYEACQVIGNLLIDRIYDSLEKMKRERIIDYTNGYAIRYDRRFITCSPGANKDLFELLFELENNAIDKFIECNNIKISGRFINRSAIKYLHSYEIDCLLKEEILSNKDSETLAKYNISVEKIQEVYDIKYIISDRRLVNEVLESDYYKRSQELLNIAAQNRILSSKSKQLEKYNMLRKGLVDICVDLTTRTNYNNIINSLE